MNLISIILELFLAGLMGLGIHVGIKLERRLKHLRESQADFGKAVTELNDAAARAENGLMELRQATREAQTALAERTHEARTGSARLEQQIRHELAARDLSLQRFYTRQCERRALVEMRVLVHCQPGGRPGMVRLVQRLGLEPLVRAVRWESVPQPARALAAA